MKRFALTLLLLLFGDYGFGQVAYRGVAIAIPQIAVGGESDGPNYVTLLQLVNNNSSAISGHIALWADNGSPLPALFDGAGPNSTTTITLAAGESRQIQITRNGAITAGWMQLSYTPSDAETTAILQFRSGATILSEVGVAPAVSTIAATDFAAETDPALNTGIAVANPSPAAQSVLARLWDPGTGALLQGTALALPPNGHIAKLLTDLFPTVPNVTQIRAMLSLDSCADSSCSRSGGNGFIATAIRLNGDQLTTIPVADRPEEGSPVRVLPHVAFGGPAGGLNMKTVLYFTTNVSTGVFGTAEVFDNDGNPLVVSADGAAPSSSITVTVAGNRVSRIVLSGDELLRSGWIRLTLSGEVHLIANAVFQIFEGSTLASEASVLESDPIERGLIYVKAQAGLSDVGVALANSEAAPSTVTLVLFNKEGFVSGTRDVALPANGHLAQFVTELFPQVASVADFDGALSIRSETPFSALALRLSAGKIATLRVAPDGMYRTSLTSLRATSTQRSPAQVNFEVDVTDFDSDIAVASSTDVLANAFVDFGTAGYDFGPVTMDGTALLDRAVGVLRGSFRLPHVEGAIPSGVTATFYINLFDSAGNESNIISVPITF